LVGDGADTVGGCGGFGPDHAYRFVLLEPMRLQATLVTQSAVIYLRSTCDDPMSQLACDQDQAIAEIDEVLKPGEYTLWVDTQNGTGGSYTLNYSFLTDPCIGVACAGDLVCVSEDWVTTSCTCPPGTQSAGGDTCTPIIPPLEVTVDIDISNTCELSVTPETITVPSGQLAELTFVNGSVDYHAHLDSTPGVDNLSLGMNESWVHPLLWCTDGVSGYTDISASEGCSSTHRLHITCL